MLVWVQFVGSAIIIVLAANYLARYGDAIALRTGLSGMFVGTLLLAGATSLPELLTNINAIRMGVPNLAAGNVFGSNMFNMLMLGIIDVMFWRRRVLRHVATSHALSASIAILLIGMSVFFILADIDISIGWLGIDSLLLMVAYFVGVRLLGGGDERSDVSPSAEELTSLGIPTLRRAVLGFSLAALALVLINPLLVRSSINIAEITGLGAGFVGAALVATVTSLPEMTTTIVAVRMGAYDLAVGNLFGSNMFNMAVLGFSDLFYVDGRLFGAIDPAFAITGLLGMLLTTMALIGNLAPRRRRLRIVEIDALLIIVVYALGLWLLYARAVGV